VFCSMLQCDAVCCSVLQLQLQERCKGGTREATLSATHCNTLQHAYNTATHCNTRGRQRSLQHTATRCSKLQHTATHYNTRGRRWSTVAAKKPRCSSLGVSLMIKRNTCPKKALRFPHSNVHFRQGRKSKVT